MNHNLFIGPKINGWVQGINNMDNRCCPNCREDEELVDTVSILLTLEDWDGALAFFGLIIVFTVLIGLEHFEALAFGALAAFPFLFRVVSKKNCLRCDVQFSTEEEQV